jgi:hypothetical protein
VSELEVQKRKSPIGKCWGIFFFDNSGLECRFGIYLMGKYDLTSPDTIIDQLKQRGGYLTSAEVMAILRINRATLCRYCRLGVLPHMRMPDNSYRFNRKSIQIWIAQWTVEPQR